jgi:hypothetical protein
VAPRPRRGARTRLAPADTALAEAYPAQYRGRALSVAPLPRFGTSTSPMDERVLTTVAIVFLGLTSAVLLIVCLNLASVLVARGEARRREFAIRLALGGGRGRIIRQLLVEALLIGGAAAVGGMLVAVPAIDTFFGTLLARLPISLAVDAGTSGAATVAAFAFGVVAAVVFALGPALIHSRDRQFADLKHQLGDTAPRSGAGSVAARGAQVALSLACSWRPDSSCGWRGMAPPGRRDGGRGHRDRGPRCGAAGLDQRAPPCMRRRVGWRRCPAWNGRHRRHRALRCRQPGRGCGAGTWPARRRPATPAEGRAFEAKWNAVGAVSAAMGLTLAADARSPRPRPSARAPPVRSSMHRGAPALARWRRARQSIHLGDDPPAAARRPWRCRSGIVSPQVTNVFLTRTKARVRAVRAGLPERVHFHVRPRAGVGAPGGRRVIQATRPGAALRCDHVRAHLVSSIEFWGCTLPPP